MDTQLMDLIYASIIGLLVGSFLNVVIYRLPRALMDFWEGRHPDPVQHIEGQMPSPYACLISPPSTTPCCDHRLQWYENIPVLSWLWLRGKCRYCSKAITARYMLVEVATAIAFFTAIWVYGLTWTGVFYCAFFSLAISLFFIDLETYLLPDGLTLLLLWLGLVGSALEVLPNGAKEAVIGAVFGYLLPFSINALFCLIRKKNGFGGGDFKLLAALGAWLGAVSIVPILGLASILALVTTGLSMLIRGEKIALQKMLPFGPFLLLAGVGMLIFHGEKLIWVWMLPG